MLERDLKEKMRRKRRQRYVLGNSTFRTGTLYASAPSRLEPEITVLYWSFNGLENWRLGSLTKQCNDLIDIVYTDGVRNGFLMRVDGIVIDSDD